LILCRLGIFPYGTARGGEVPGDMPERLSTATSTKQRWWEKNNNNTTGLDEYL